MDLFDYVPTLPSPPAQRAFDGATYAPERDYERLSGQLKAVYDLMRDSKWRTLSDIRETVEGSEAAISARLRDLRKTKYGSYTIEREHIDRGLYRYRMVMA